MSRTTLLYLIILLVAFINCQTENKNPSTAQEQIQKRIESHTLTKHLRTFNDNLFTIGLLMYNGILQIEVIAASDLFAKPSINGKPLFNFVSIAEIDQAIYS